MFGTANGTELAPEFDDKTAVSWESMLTEGVTGDGLSFFQRCTSNGFTGKVYLERKNATMSGVSANIWVTGSKTGRGLSSDELIIEGSGLGGLIAAEVILVFVATGLS
jgi:hypothetical protein